MKQEKIEWINHFIGAVDVRNSTEEKMNIIYMAGYPQMPGAREYWQLHEMLSQNDTYKDIMEHILLVPFSELLCRTDENRKGFQEMRKMAQKRWQEELADNENIKQE